ncbi:MAG: 2-amino-4-hydroxy-6-hydroxymethyldihydropteridine diphosphokinase [Lachnospiraceae bacterium]|nr:2-amino-4-hydroxy-6-hydroxymethyldihydropteridine diphosphokinase [Lachnospiraceae bacterium]
MDKIKIKNLEIFANHGVFPEENALGQKFVISAILHTDTRKAGKTDDLSLSMNYGEVSAKITEFVQGHTYMLLERLLEELAQELLLTYDLLKEITLEVKKPWAPVHLPLETVAVEITRGWHKAYVACGSNMGDRKAYLQMGVDELAAHPLCRMGQVSDFITTAPYGYLAQDDFLNGVMEVETLLTPEELLDVLHEIEQKANRVREIHWGPRTLDLDILFYDDAVIDTRDLHIPHIDMQKRDFVLKPMDQIAPWLRHPVLNKTIHELAQELEAV